MSRADVLKLFGAAAGLAIIVALISPPTKPVPAPAGDWRKQIPVKTGTPAPAASTAPVPAAALLRRPPPASSRQRGARPRPRRGPAVPPATSSRCRRSRAARGPRERRYRQGYHWAQRNDIDDERDCYRAAWRSLCRRMPRALRDGDDDRALGYPSTIAAGDMAGIAETRQSALDLPIAPPQGISPRDDAGRRRGSRSCAERSRG